MPSTLTPIEISTMARISAEEWARKETMQKAWNAYQGAVPGSNGSTPERFLVTEPAAVDDNVPINLIGLLVDVSGDYLFGSPPTIELPKEKDAEETDVRSEPEKWLDQVFEANNWPILLLEAGVVGPVFGTTFVGLDTNDPYPNPENPDKPFPRIVLKDSYCMSIQYDLMDITRIVGYTWQSIGPIIQRPYETLPVTGYQFIRRKPDGKWTITDAYQRLNGDPPIAIASYDWPYTWPPIVHWKNLPAPNDPYGKPEVNDSLIQKNAALSFNMSKRQRIDRKHAHPKFVTTGVSHELRAEEDVWELEEDASAELLAPATTSSSAEQTGLDIYGYILEESSTPAVVVGRAPDGGIPSGVQLLISMQPIIRKTLTKRTMVEPALKELCRRLWELGGFGSDLVAKVTWFPLVPTDPLQQRTIAQTDIEVVGIKRDVIAKGLGYKEGDLDPDFISKAQAPLAQPPGGVPGKPDTNSTTPGAQEKARKEAK